MIGEAHQSWPMTKRKAQAIQQKTNKPASVLQLFPRWTKRAVIEDTGRDPLGLNSVAHMVSGFLLPGIITTTDRARYYSFFCWALQHVNEHDQWKSYTQFWDGMRRREATMILATLLYREETNGDALKIDGIQQGEKYFEKGKSEGEFSCDFSPLPSNSLGAYGQYYKGPMGTLGLIQSSEEGIHQIVESSRALRLAQAYGANIRNTSWIRKRLHTEDQIPKNILEGLAEAMSLDCLHQPWAKMERDELIHLFFANDEDSPDNLSLNRRNTLLLMMDIIDSYDRHDRKLALDKFYKCGFLAPVYYEELLLDEDQTAPYSAPQNLRKYAELWQQFALHYFLTHALESLLEAVLEVAGDSTIGVSITKLIDALTGREFSKQIEGETDNQAVTPRKYLYWLGVEDFPPKEKDSRKFAEKAKLLSQMSEMSLVERECKTSSELAWKAVTLILRLYLKWRGKQHEAAMVNLEVHAQNELWMGTQIQFVDELLAGDPTWKELVEHVTRKLILDRHDLVMYSKRRLDACWLHFEKGRVFKDQDYGPRIRSPRWANGLSIMRDLGLVNVNDKKDLSLTNSGRKLYETLK